MKIESISFGNSDIRSIMSGISPYLSEVREVETPSDDADILFIAIDGEKSVPFLEKTQLPEEPMKIFIVHTLIGAVIPFFKEADYIIYLAEYQKKVVEAVLNVSFRSEHLYFPGTEAVLPETRENAFVYLPNSYSEELEGYFKECLTLAKSWFGDLAERVQILFNVPEDKQAQYNSFVDENGSGVECFVKQALSRDAVREMIASSKNGDCFVNEVSHEQVQGYIEEVHPDLLYLPFKTDWILEEMARSSVHVFNDYNGITRTLITDGHDTITFEIFAERINVLFSEVRQEIEKESERVSANTEVDTLDTINIAAGAPLKNSYVFSICFRNQEEKVIRAIDSICSQKGGIDYGIAIVDDCSTDRSSEKIMERLEGSGVDYVLVTNKKRRFASRNFYNVIHLLVDSEDSVLIELDGDDYLADEEVLISVDEAYRAGALKTSGSFSIYPDMNSYAAKDIFAKHKDMDFARPWSIAACNTWLPLRSAKMSILGNIEIDYFLERHTKQWLADRHDAITQSRAIELAGPNRCTFIDRPLYVYDLSGADHDHGDHEEYNKADFLIKLYRDLDKYHRGYSL